MARYRRIFFLLAIQAFLLVDVWAGTLVLESQPGEAEVFVQSLKGGAPIRIGKTPFQMPLDKIAKSAAESEVFVLILEKLGYEPKRYVMSDISNSDIELTAILDPSEEVNDMTKVDAVMVDLFEATRLIRLGLYTEAISLLEEKAKAFPLLSTIPELIGTAYYLNKQQKQALAFYDKAVALNSNNLDAVKMKNLLSKSLGAKTGEKK